ncbi:MAG: hypothetical protein KF862_22960 [Chitinophagaceae bacterium]|nr:hypothetical protein [Chitinophagaceae bacterium]
MPVSRLAVKPNHFALRSRYGDDLKKECCGGKNSLHHRCTETALVHEAGAGARAWADDFGSCIAACFEVLNDPYMAQYQFSTIKKPGTIKAFYLNLLNK